MIKEVDQLSEEDKEDIRACEERANEKSIPFEEFVEELKKEKLL
jgi:hypothetical protein